MIQNSQFSGQLSISLQPFLSTMVSKSATLCFFVVVCLFVVLRRSEAASDNHLTKRSKVRVCGKALAELMSAICRGIYNSPSQNKRSIDDEVASVENGPIKGGMFDTAIETLGQRTSRGIVNECCYQSCKMSTLRSYCGPMNNNEEEEEERQEE